MGIMNFPFNGSFRLFESETDFVYVSLPERVNSKDFEKLVAVSDPKYCTPTNLLKLERDKDELQKQLKELKHRITAEELDRESEIADMQRKRAKDLEALPALIEGMEAGANFTRIMPPQTRATVSFVIARTHLYIQCHPYASNHHPMLSITKQNPHSMSEPDVYRGHSTQLWYTPRYVRSAHVIQCVDGICAHCMFQDVWCLLPQHLSSWLY